MTIKQIETGAMSPAKQDCAFLWLYCLDGVPYRKYLPAGAPETMPMVLVTLRWAGAFGTMGGKVDKGEDLRQALAREACEEANFWIPSNEVLEQLGTFRDGEWHIHSFALQVTHDELVQARTKANRLTESSQECTGWCIIPTRDYMPDESVARGITAFKTNNFRSTAGLEFEALLALINGKC